SGKLRMATSQVTRRKHGSETTGLAEKQKESALSQLRFPLVFFGLALTVVESAFGFVLVQRTNSDHTVIVLAAWMGSLFALSILLVGFLTYARPTHIMLQAQPSIAQGIKTARTRRAMRVFAEYSESTNKSASTLLATLDRVEAILEGREEG